MDLKEIIYYALQILKLKLLHQLLMKEGQKTRMAFKFNKSINTSFAIYLKLCHLIVRKDPNVDTCLCMTDQFCCTTVINI